MTADQKQKLMEVQRILNQLFVFGIEENENLISARRLVRDMLIEPHPFKEHWEPGVEVHPV